MSSHVDNRVVNMQFNNQQFEAGVQQTIKSLDELKQSLNLNTGVTGLNTVQRAFDHFSISSIDNKIDALTQRFSTLGIVGMTAIQNITNKMIALASGKLMNAYNTIITGGKSRASTAARAKFTLEGMFDGAVDKAEKVETAFQSARDAVTGTAYTMSSAVSVASQLAATGIDVGDELKNILLGVAGVASMTGDSFDNIGNIYTTIAGNGRLMGMQLTQLSTHGLNAAAIIAKHLNTTEAAVREMTSKGEIDFQTFSDAMYLAFGTHAQEANKTFSGVTDNIKSNLSRIGEVFYSGIFQNDDLIKFLDNFRLALGKVREQIQKLEEPFKNLVSAISKVMSIKVVKLGFEGFGKFVDIIQKGIETLTGFIEKYWDLSNAIHDSALGRAVEKTSEGMTKVTKISEKQYLIAKKIWEGPNKWGNGEERMKKLGVDYKYVQAYVNALKDANFDESKVAIEVMKRNKETMEGVIESSETAVDSVAEVSDGYSTFEAILAGIMSFGDGIKSIFNSVKNVAKSIYKSFKKVFKIIDIAKDLSFMGHLFSQLSKYFEINEERAGKLERAFTGLWSAIDIIKRVMQEAAQFVADTFGPIFSKLFDIFLTIIAYIGDAIAAVDEWEKEHGIIHSTFKLLGTVIKNVIEIVKEFFEKLVNMPAMKKIIDKIKELGIYISENFGPKIEAVTGYIEEFFDKLDSEGKGGVVMTSILEGINWLLEKAIGLFGFLKDTVMSVFDWFKGKKEVIEGGGGAVASLADSVGKLSDSADNLTKKSGFVGFIDNIADAFGSVGVGIGTFISGIVEGFKSINFVKVSLIGLVTAMTALSAGLGYFFTKVGKAVGMFQAIGESITGAFNAVRDTINSIGETRKMDAKTKMIKAIALAIAILTLSLIALTFVDQKKLKNAVIALGAIIAVLGVFAIVLLMFAKKVKNYKQTETTLRAMATALILFAASVWIIADAFAKLAAIKWENGIKRPLIAMITIIAIMTVVAITLADLAPELSTGGVSLLAFASSIWLIVKSLEKLEGMKVEGIKPKLDILYQTLLVIGAVALLASRFKFRSALGIVVVLGSIFLIEKILQDIAKNGVTMEQLKGHIAPLLSALGILVAVIAVLSMISDVSEDADPSKAAGSLLKVVIAVFILSRIVNYLGMMDINIAARGTALLSDIIFDILVMCIAIALVKKDIEHVGGTVLKIATAIGVLAIIVALMGLLDPKAANQGIRVVEALSFMVMFMIAVTHIAGKIDYKAIWAMVGAISVMAIILIAFVYINKFTELYLAVGALGIALLALGTSMYLASVAAKKATPKIIIAMIVAVITIATSLYVLAGTNWKALLVAAISMSAVLLAMGLAFKIFMSAFYSKEGASRSVSKQRIEMLALMILAIAVIGAALSGITAAAGKNYGTVIAAAMAISLILGVIMGVMVGITKYSAKKPSKELLNEIALMILAVVAIAAALALLMSLNQPWTSYIMPIIAIGLILTEIVAALFILNKFANKKMQPTNVVAIGLMVLAVVAIAASLSLLLAGNYNWGKMLVAAVSMGLVLAAVVGALVILGKAAGTEAGAIGVLIAAVTICATLAILAITLPFIANGFILLTDALVYFSKTKLPMSAMLKFVGVMALFAIGAVLAGAAVAVLSAALVILGVALIAVGAGAILIALAVDIFCTAIERISKVSPKAGENVKKLGAGIKSAFIDVMSGLAQGIVDFFSIIVTNAPTIISAITLIVEGIVKAIGTAITSVVEMIAKALTAIINAVGDLAEPLVASIVKIFKALADHSEEFGYYGAQIIHGFITGLINWLTDHIDEIIDNVTKVVGLLIDAIVGCFKTLFEYIGEGFTIVTTYVAAGIVKLKNKVWKEDELVSLETKKELLDDLIENRQWQDEQGNIHENATEEQLEEYRKAREEVEKEIEGYKDAGDYMIEGMWADLDEKHAKKQEERMAETKQKADDTLNELNAKGIGEDKGSEFLSGVEKSFDSSDSSSFLSKWFGGGDEAGEAGEDASEEFVKRATKKLEASKLPKDVFDKLLNSDDWHFDGTYFTSELAVGYQDAVEKATDGYLNQTALYDQADEVIEELKKKGDEAGKWWLQGIENGVKDSEALKRIESGVASVGALINKDIRVILKISSPSKEGVEVGKFWNMGIAKGIHDYMDMPAQESLEVGNNMVKVFGVVMHDIYASLNEMDELQPTITPVVDMSQVNMAGGYIDSTLRVGDLAADTSLSFNNASENNLAAQVQALTEQVNKLANQDYSTMFDGVSFNIDASTNVDGAPLKSMASKYTIEQIDDTQRGLVMAGGGRI